MDAQDRRPHGVIASLRAALNAGLLSGFVFGLVDGLVAGSRTGISGAWNWIGCLGAAVVVYGLTWVAGLLLVALVGHPFLRTKDLSGRLGILAGLGLGLGLFFEMYWWSRESLFSGVSSTDPRRLAAGLVMLVLGLGLGALVSRLGRRLPQKALWGGAFLVPLMWFAGIAYLSGARSASEARGRPNARTEAMPNVLLVVVDALRQDTLGCYGDQRVQTPVLDAVAERGVVFDNAWVQAPFTWSSFGSILTGKYPRRHGLVKMAGGVRMAPNVTLPWHLKSAAVEGAEEALEPEDYAASAFMTGTLSHGSGLLRGFDVYFEALVGHDLVELDNPWSVFRSELVLSLLRTKLDAKLQTLRNQDPVATMARRWFEENGDRRFVSMVHFYSTHTPYDPPARFRDMYVDPDYDGPIDAFYAEYRVAIESGEFEPSAADRQQITDLYYAGVSQADAMFGQLLDELERHGVLDDTLIVFTSDHGEELGDHDLWEHNFMYETNLQVPLVMALPGVLPAGVRSEALVESVDIVPSVCALLGIQPPYEEDQLDEKGRDRGAIDGLDVGPLVRGEVESLREHSFAENGVYMAVRDRRFKLILPSSNLAREDWRAAPSPGVEGARLFDLEADPDEHRNVLSEYPDQAEGLLEVLRAWDAQLPVPLSDVVQSARDLETQRALIRSLGYADGVGQGFAPDEDAGVDPEREP